MQIVRTGAEVRTLTEAWRQQGLRVALVPTMGNLHAGHLSLVAAAARHAERVVVSLFVNPLQFGPQEDFADYPRTWEADADQLREAGVHALFAPEVVEIYPRPLEAMTRVVVPGLSEILCGEARPGHFDGVATVVCQLLMMVGPDCAVFGRKDFQQLILIQRMVADLRIPVEILGAPTVREADGLAMSSRNQYLTDQQRSQAPLLRRTLEALAVRIRAGEGDLQGLEAWGLARLRRAGLAPDYLRVLRARDLRPPEAKDRALVILVAARLGRARLIDNLEVAR